MDALIKQTEYCQELQDLSLYELTSGELLSPMNQLDQQLPLHESKTSNTSVEEIKNIEIQKDEIPEELDYEDDFEDSESYSSRKDHVLDSNIMKESFEIQKESESDNDKEIQKQSESDNDKEKEEKETLELIDEIQKETNYLNEFYKEEEQELEDSISELEEFIQDLSLDPLGLPCLPKKSILSSKSTIEIEPVEPVETLEPKESLEKEKDQIDTITERILNDLIQSSLSCTQESLKESPRTESPSRTDEITHILFNDLLKEIKIMCESRVYNKNSGNEKTVPLIELDLSKDISKDISSTFGKGLERSFVTSIIQKFFKSIPMGKLDGIPIFPDNLIATLLPPQSTLDDYEDYLLILDLTKEALQHLFSEHERFKDPIKSRRLGPRMKPPPIDKDQVMDHVFIYVLDALDYIQINGENLDALLIKQVKAEESQWKTLEQDVRIEMVDQMTESILHDLLTDTTLALKKRYG